MTITTRPNGRHPEQRPAVTLRKLTDPPIAAEVPYDPKSVPKKEIATSLIGRGPIPLAWLTMVLALVSEQWRIGAQRAASTFSNLEALVMSKGMAGGAKLRDQGAARLAEVVDQYQRVTADIAGRRVALTRLDQAPVCGANGEVLSASSATSRMQTVAATVEQERDAGSLKHRRVPARFHRLIIIASLLDFPVLLYFVTQVFNVDLAGLAAGDGAAWGESLIPLITSVVFALLGTAAVAVGLKFFGRDVKGYKDADGHITLPEGTAKIIPLIFIGLSAALAIGAGIVMAYRIVADSVAAGNGIGSAVILGVFFAVVVIVVNVVVFAVYYRDGSLLTDEIGQLAAQLEPIERQRVEFQRQIDALIPELEVLRVKGEQVYATTIAKMGEAIKGADQVRLLARSYHQGCGPEAELIDQHDNPLRGLLLPDATVDTSMLDALLKRMAPDEKITDPYNGEESDAKLRGDTAIPAVVPAVDLDDELGGEW
ncbi:hypothetical protein [Nocardia sp. MW-W600-9]